MIDVFEIHFKWKLPALLVTSVKKTVARLYKSPTNKISRVHNHCNRNTNKNKYSDVKILQKVLTKLRTYTQFDTGNNKTFS